MRDVVVIGGGPGGLYAATRIARRGFRAHLYEEHPHIGSPVHCTGVLAREAFAEFDLPGDARLNDLRTARFVSPSGHAVEYTTPDVEAVVIDRIAFDRLLGEQAAAAGVRMERERRATSVSTDADGATVTFEGGATVRARAVVLACGANYVLQRRLGLGLPKAYMQSAQAELPCHEDGDVEVHFGSAIAPGGFAWAVPVRRPDGPYVRVGVMASREAGPFFQRMLERVAPAWGIAVDGAIEPRRRMLPLAPIDRTYTDRVLVVGDAAGLVKATTGGGIYYSLLSAGFAADVLCDALAHGHLEASRLASYETLWMAKCSPEFSAQLQLREAAERMSDDDIDDLFMLARTEGIMPIIRRTARFNRHRELALALLKHPPARQIFFRRLAGFAQ
jgi:digeranylgeranylglycerophospholipid reductase